MRKIWDKISDLKWLIVVMFFGFFVGVSMTNPEYSILVNVLSSVITLIIIIYFVSMFRTAESYRKFSRKKAIINSKRQDIYIERMANLLNNEKWNEAKKLYKFIKNENLKTYYRGYLDGNDIDTDDLN